MPATLVLALLAVPIFMTATTVNLIAFVRYRREHFGPALIILLMAALSLGYAFAYTLSAAGAFPHLEPPTNVVLLRPLVLITGILFTIIPGWLISFRQEHENAEQVKELLTKAHFRREQIAALESELASTKQLLEMCQTVNTALQVKEQNEQH